jgi:hypothetical protein
MINSQAKLGSQPSLGLVVIIIIIITRFQSGD